jgi:hypothetical protein
MKIQHQVKLEDEIHTRNLNLGFTQSLDQELGV